MIPPPLHGRLVLRYPVKLIIQVVVCPEVTRACMALKKLSAGRTSAETTQLTRLFCVPDFLVSDGPQILANPETTSVS